MDKDIRIPKDARNFKAKTAGAVLAIAGIAAGCGSTSERPLDQVTVVGDNEKYQQELIANGGVNVRTFPGLDGVVVGQAPAGAKLEDVIVTSGDGGNWIKGKCLEMPIENPIYEFMPRESNDPYAPVVESAICYVNGNYVNE